MTGRPGWAGHTLQLIRDTLTPMLEQARENAHTIGGDLDRQHDKAHWVGQATGLSDAIRALEVAFEQVPRTCDQPGPEELRGLNGEVAARISRRAQRGGEW